jgi:hypothetical protein
VENHTKSDIQAFIPDIRRNPLRIISGPAKSTPVTANGREILTL